MFNRLCRTHTWLNPRKLLLTMALQESCKRRSGASGDFPAPGAGKIPQLFRWLGGCMACAMSKKKTQLEIGEDIAQQQQVWLLERIAWTVTGLILLAALLGFVGHGFFSERETGSTEAGIRVAWQRFERHQAQSLLSVQLTATAPEPQTRLRLGQDFLGRIQIVRIEPEPARVELDGAFTTYVFNVNAPGLILFHFMPIGLGSTQIEIGLEGRALQTLPQFVYP
jgi:hypothetical protein